MEDRRLSVKISHEEQIRMHNLLPAGIISKVIRLLLLQTLDLVEKYGAVVLGAILSGKLSALDILREEERNGTQRPKDNAD